MENKFHTARWWQRDEGTRIRCFLCPRECLIPDGKTGFCGIRKNMGGELFSLAYGRPAAIHVDPIEKKPLNKFLPGTLTFSIGTYGCNLECAFCQNYHLSRGKYASIVKDDHIAPEKIVELASHHSCKSIAFTYNEPTIWGEYVIDIAKIAKSEKISTVLVSNGYISRNAAEDIFPLIDAANIDMKGFSEDFYSGICGGSLAPVLDAIKFYHSLGKHLELTNLVIPGQNDSPRMIDDYLEWVALELGKDVPLHFSAYHPDYKYDKSPCTPASTLCEIREKALKKGFRSIYLGNI